MVDEGDGQIKNARIATGNEENKVINSLSSGASPVASSIATYNTFVNSQFNQGPQKSSKKLNQGGIYKQVTNSSNHTNTIGMGTASKNN